MPGRPRRPRATASSASSRAGGQRLTADAAERKGGEAVKIAVRPENVRLGSAGDGGADNRFTARVAGQRYQGTQTIYELAVLGGRLEALELGTSMRMRSAASGGRLCRPAMCWAYAAAR
jgi:iron(III) transport system ATP-binding protein